MLFLYAAPGVAVAAIAGSFLRRAIPEGKYDRAVLILLLVIGAFLLGKTIFDLT